MASAKILIVEDEGIEALDIQQRLVALGYPMPDIAQSGEEGVRRAVDTHPDLVLMDIMLPGKMDGIVAAERIRSRLNIPIIYLTAYADENTLQRAKVTEPYGYIIKPFQEKELHIAVDIALYKHQMERRLRESEERYSTTLRSIGDAVIATDRSGLVTFMNPVAEDLTGWTLHEASNKKLTEVFKVINRDTRQPVEDPGAKVLRQGSAVGLANHTLLVRKDGTETPIDDIAAPIKDEGENLTGVVLVFRDITERERVGRLKDDFIGMVSHELKTPLTVIIGVLNLVAQEGLTRDQSVDLLREAISSADGMAATVENLLELTRSQANRLHLNTRPADVSGIAREVAEKLRAKSALHHLSVDAVSCPPVVTADPVRVERILYNLVENAIKYSPDGGEISIRCRQADEALVVSVCDEGPGIPLDQQAKLFQAFERLDTPLARMTPGIGLGLKVCRTLVEAHDGRIWVESKPGKGACFLFTLPLAPAKG